MLAGLLISKTVALCGLVLAVVVVVVVAFLWFCGPEF